MLCFFFFVFFCSPGQPIFTVRSEIFKCFSQSRALHNHNLISSRCHGNGPLTHSRLNALVWKINLRVLDLSPNLLVWNGETWWKKGGKIGKADTLFWKCGICNYFAESCITAGPKESVYLFIHRLWSIRWAFTMTCKYFSLTCCLTCTFLVIWNHHFGNTA